MTAISLRALSFLLLTGVTSVVASCASPNSTADTQRAKAKSECVFFRTVYDYTPLDDTHLVIWAPSRSQPYLVELTMPLMGLKFSHSLGFIDGTNDGMFCDYGRDAVTTGRDSMPEKSTVLNIRRISPEEIAALEAKYAVKISRDKKTKTAPAEPPREKAE